MMLEQPLPKLALWPFVVADLVFLGLAFLLFQGAHRPFLWWEASLMVLCVAAAATCWTMPFLRRFSAEQTLVQAQTLADNVGQIKKLEQLAEQIGNATALWQGVQENASRTAATAREISESMAAEVKSFTEFLEKANNSEKNHLRLEVDKLRRAEGDWLQILIRMLDHTYALFMAAVRSGQPGLVEQIGQFQNHCRDTARRVGLVPVAPVAGEVYDAKLHELVPGATAPPSEALIAETIATGFTFQGQLLRRPMVVVRERQGGEEAAQDKLI